MHIYNHINELHTHVHKKNLPPLFINPAYNGFQFDPNRSVRVAVLQGVSRFFFIYACRFQVIDLAHKLIDIPYKMVVFFCILSRH